MSTEKELNSFDIDSLGQLFILGVEGTALSEEEEKLIKSHNLGGIILFKNNFENPAQLAELSNKIQSLKRDEFFFIGVDQEGGRVQRFKEPFTVFPPMLEIAKLNSPKLCFEVHQVIARELMACGVNMNFSPCCDVLYNSKNTVIGDRSFGERTEIVEKFVTAAIRGLQTNGVISIAKHFPGHGSTIKDSHYDLPFISSTKEEIVEKELPPFKKASKSRVAAMLMAHLQIDALDEDNPTTFSKKCFNFLRSELKFEGLIITDDMEMGAIAKHNNIPTACHKSLDAGADLICLRNFKQGIKAIERIKEAFKNGQLNQNEYAKKLSRIKKVKNEYIPTYKPIYIPKITEVFHREETQVLMVELTQKLADLNNKKP